MYADPSKIRDHVVKVRLNEAESALIYALVCYTGEQKASLLREMLLEQARITLSAGMDFPLFANGSEGHKTSSIEH